MNQLLKLRQKADMTQNELAALMGVSKQAVCNYEKGIRQPTIKRVNSLVRRLNEMGVACSFSDIYPPEDFKKAS